MKGQSNKLSHDWLKRIIQAQITLWRDSRDIFKRLKGSKRLGNFQVFVEGIFHSPHKGTNMYMLRTKYENKLRPTPNQH